MIDDCLKCPARIEITEGGSSYIVALNKESTTIGRGEGASIQLKGSWIAPRHATITAAGGAHQLDAQLLVSLGGQEIKSELLHDGDTLRLFGETRSSFTTIRYLNHRAPKIAPIQHFATPPGKERLTIGRIDADTTEEELHHRIKEVLENVEMSAHQETLIEALSGGQRKRISIASEMLSDPALLFLDEPTSGLDPGLERKMMYTLRSVADGGRTVVLVTHATANITQCDHIIFMAEGRMIWFGPPHQALSFFEVDDYADIYTKTEGNAARWEERFKASLQHQKYVVERLARAPEKRAKKTGEAAPYL